MARGQQKVQSQAKAQEKNAKIKKQQVSIFQGIFLMQKNLLKVAHKKTENELLITKDSINSSVI